MENDPKEKPRPSLCPEKCCKPFWNMFPEEEIQKGYSGDCLGIMGDVKFIYKEAEHINNWSHCIFTPLKGMIRYQINSGDAWRIYLLMGAILDKEKPLVCEECGFQKRAFGETVIKYTDRSLCPVCAFRLGRREWNTEEKRYQRSEKGSEFSHKSK
jgi:hypothetical protein